MKSLSSRAAKAAETTIDQGTICQADWDKHNWTLSIEVIGSGPRLLQVPAYDKTPRVGDRVQLTGRNPLLGIQINGVDISLQQTRRASEHVSLFP
jgi:hypothetical protein